MLREPVGSECTAEAVETASVAATPRHRRLEAEILLAPDGTVRGASASARLWVDLGEVAEIYRRVSATLLGVSRKNLRMRAGDREIHFIRLEGAGGTTYLARVTPMHHGAWRELLSPRQQEVCEFAVAGATTKEIATALRCSPGTVRTHLEEIYRRLEVSSRVELTQLVFSND